MDITLYTREAGTGQPLVLLHGNGEDGSYFEAQIACFSSRYHVIAVDTRGHGQTPRGDAPFTLEQFAEDLKAFLDQRGLLDIFLLGFSDGGNIALLFALKYPEYIKKLILNGANLTPAGVKKNVQLPICIGYGLVSLLSLFDKKAAAKRELLGLMVTQPHIPADSLRSLPMPTLVIAGTKDMIAADHTRLIAASIPGSRLCLIEGGHFIAAKQPEEFNREVESFLEEQPEEVPAS